MSGSAEEICGAEPNRRIHRGGSRGLRGRTSPVRGGPSRRFIPYGEEAKRVYGESIPSQFAHKRIAVIRQPAGVVFGITPWNFPSAMVTRKVAPALAAGCTFILKPAEQTPLAAIFLATL